MIQNSYTIPHAGKLTPAGDDSSKVARIFELLKAIHVPFESNGTQMLNKLKRKAIAVCELPRKC
jgi:hypothetical protein